MRATRWFARRFATVRRQLGVLSLTSILLVVATTAVSLALLTRLSHANRSLEADLIPAQTQISSLDRLYRDLEVDSSSTLTADQIASTTKIADDLTIAAAELLAADPGLSNGLSAVDDAATAWIDMLATGDERSSAAFDTLRADLTRLEGDVAERVGDRQRTASQATSALRVVLIASGALITGFGVLAARIVRRSITRPIDDLVAQVGAVAAGDLSTTIVASGPADLASVGATVEAMRHRMLDDAERRVESALITGHLAENDRIAGQLHDDQVQAMILASIRLQRLRRKLDSDDELGSLAAAAEQATNGAITGLRRMIFELHSPVLESDGLSAAIEAYLDETFGDTVSWTVSGGSDVDLPPSTAGLLYRLSREAMFNTFKHGGASRIDVVVNRHSEVAEVTVADDGVGFDPATQATSGPGHLGLAYCSDLAAAAGGTWTCVSQPGHGTTVRISLPIATR